MLSVSRPMTPKRHDPASGMIIPQRGPGRDGQCHRLPALHLRVSGVGPNSMTGHLLLGAIAGCGTFIILGLIYLCFNVKWRMMMMMMMMRGEPALGCTVFYQIIARCNDSSRDFEVNAASRSSSTSQ